MPRYFALPRTECKGAAKRTSESADDRPIGSPRQRRLRAVCLGLATVATVLLVARSMASSPDKAESKTLQSFSYPAALGRLQRRPRANATSIVSALSSSASSSAARTTELFRANRGTFDERTGILLLQCSDTVQWGSYQSKDSALVGRFHGEVGKRYTVECPTYCIQAETNVYGCNNGPYMDTSSICKAAIAAGVAGNKEISTFTFRITEPVQEYEACQAKGKKYLGAIPLADAAASNNGVTVSTFSWKWEQWGWATRPDNVKKICTSGWAAQNPGKLCDGVKEKYRQNCKMRDGIYNCFGARSFSFLVASSSPVMEPSAGVYEVKGRRERGRGALT